jgi:hypothetical protein
MLAEVYEDIVVEAVAVIVQYEFQFAGSLAETKVKKNTVVPLRSGCGAGHDEYGSVAVTPITGTYVDVIFQ